MAMVALFLFPIFFFEHRGPSAGSCVVADGSALGSLRLLAFPQAFPATGVIIRCGPLPLLEQRSCSTLLLRPGALG